MLAYFPQESGHQPPLHLTWSDFQDVKEARCDTLTFLHPKFALGIVYFLTLTYLHSPKMSSSTFLDILNRDKGD